MKRCLLDSSFVIDLLNEIAEGTPGPAICVNLRHLRTPFQKTWPILIFAIEDSLVGVAQCAVENQYDRCRGAPDVAIAIRDRPEITANFTKDPKMPLMI